VTYLLSLVAIGLVLLYAGLLSMLWWFQERVVFQPPGGVAPSEVPAERVTYRAADGVQLFAFVVGECSPDSTVMLAFHGNADLARWLVPWATVVVRETRACVVIPEYRGYDSLPGRPSYAGSSLDARAALAWVHDSLHAPSSNIVYFGHSLGTAIAAELAGLEPPRALVLQSPFSTARAMAGRMFLPGLTAFWRMVSRVHFDTIERVRTLRAPVWVAHGDRDIIIPVRMGREVFASAGNRGELLIVRGAGHNDVADVGGRDYWAWLSRAVRGLSPVGSTRDAPAGTRSAP
jgi:hypothetical protein